MTRWHVLAALMAALILNLALIQPNHPDALAWDGFLVFPLELPVILAALLALGQSRASVVLRALLVGALTLMVVLKTTDLVMFKSLNRTFNPVGDLPLVGSFYDLIAGNLGPVAAFAAVVAAIFAIFALAAVFWWSMRVWARIAVPRRPVAAGAAVVAVLGTGLAVTDIGAKTGRWSAPVPYVGTAFTARLGVERVQMARDTVADLRVFRTAAQNDPFTGQAGLFDLVDRDVIGVFVESYGRTGFDTPFYSGVHLDTLRAAQADLDARGLSMTSTFLGSPTQGGQSWLAQSTFANGLWIPDQNSYRAALASGRQTLFHLAQQSGFHTGAVMRRIRRL